ncbi:hypothetical protein CR513_62668, partial [Mucuna pruriens]
MGVRIVLLQEGHSIVFFSEKLKGAQLNYSTYDNEFYTLVWVLQTCQIEFLEQFSYVIKHKQGKVNIVVNVLSIRHTLLAMLETKLLGFESLKDLYMADADFNDTYDRCVVSVNGGFFRHEGKVFVSKRSIKELLVKEAPEGGLIGHFDVHKIYEALCEHFYWPKLRRDVQHICERCLVYKMAKSKASSNGLYTLFHIPIAP